MIVLCFVLFFLLSFCLTFTWFICWSRLFDVMLCYRFNLAHCSILIWLRVQLMRTVGRSVGPHVCVFVSSFLYSLNIQSMYSSIPFDTETIIGIIAFSTFERDVNCFFFLCKNKNQIESAFFVCIWIWKWHSFDMHAHNQQSLRRGEKTMRWTNKTEKRKLTSLIAHRDGTVKSGQNAMTNGNCFVWRNYCAFWSMPNTNAGWLWFFLCLYRFCDTFANIFQFSCTRYYY